MLKRSIHIGEKKNIFIIRHENDLDFMLPLLLYATNPIVFIWGLIAGDDFRLVLLKKNGISPAVLSGLSKTIPERLVAKFLKLTNKKAHIRYIKKLNIKKANEMVDSLSQYLKNIDANKVSKVIFDHTINITVEMMIKELRIWGRKSLVIYSLPHGQSVCVNKMYRYKMLTPNENVHNWGVFDKVVSFSKHQENVAFKSVDSSQQIILPSLRNTKEWLGVLTNEIRGASQNAGLSHQGDKKIKFLIIHSLLASNINEKELERCVKILDQFGMYDVRIKPHPRRVPDALKLDNNYTCISLIHEHITECIHWSDYVLFFHSSAVYDAFLLNKTVFYPNYMSSNKLNDDVLKHCKVLNTPDDFYAVMKKISEGGEEKPSTYYSVPKWDSLVDEWGAILN